MIYISNVPVTMEINTVQDLSKLGAFMEQNNLKVNISEIARGLHINLSRLDVVAIEEHKIEGGIYNIFEITVTGVGYNENQIQG